MKLAHDSQNNSRSILKNMMVLATGTGFAKIVGILAMPIITRIYAPEDMGALAIFAAMAALLIPFGSLRYAVTLPLPRHDALALNLAVASFVFLIVITLISTGFLFFAAEPILSLFSMEKLHPYWWLLPITIFGGGLYEILNSWAIREKAFKPIAKTKVWQSILGSLTQIGLGFIGFKLLGLLIGYLVLQTSGILSLAIIFAIKWKKYRAKLSWAKTQFLLRWYADYPKYRLPSQCLLVFSMQAPLLFSAYLFGAETTGQLGLALMALALPVALFGHTTGQAYYAEIAKLGRKKPQNILKITKSIVLKLFVVSIPPFLILFFLGPWIFETGFGSAWREAGVFASILATYLLLQFVSAPIVNALSVFNNQRMFLSINIRRSILLIAVFAIAYFYSFPINTTLIMFSLVMSAHYAIVTLSIFRVIRKECL